MNKFLTPFLRPFLFSLSWDHFFFFSLSFFYLFFLFLYKLLVPFIPYTHKMCGNDRVYQSTVNQSWCSTITIPIFSSFYYFLYCFVHSNQQLEAGSFDLANEMKRGTGRVEKWGSVFFCWTWTTTKIKQQTMKRKKYTASLVITIC